MRFLLVFVLFKCAMAVTPGGLYKLNWEIKNPDRQGADNVEFSWKVPNKTQFRGYYLAMQFGFVGRKPIAYCGIQPQADGSCATMFSAFGPNVEITDGSICHEGADGGPGATCYTSMHSYQPNTRYYIQVGRKKNDKQHWTATITDKKGYSQPIGSWKLPTSSRGISAKQVGFMEGFLDFGDSCSSMPNFEAVYYKPKVKGKKVELSGGRDVGKCRGKFALNVRKNSKFHRVRVRGS